MAIIIAPSLAVFLLWCTLTPRVVCKTRLTESYTMHDAILKHFQLRLSPAYSKRRCIKYSAKYSSPGVAMIRLILFPFLTLNHPM